MCGLSEAGGTVDDPGTSRSGTGHIQEPNSRRVSFRYIKRKRSPCASASRPKEQPITVLSSVSSTIIDVVFTYR
jgi:hypothetical protein